MPKDKYSALWLSYSSISDYLKCPRLYYLRNIWRSPKTNHKIVLMQPSLALGHAIHEVIDSISHLAVDNRLTIPLSDRLKNIWISVSGKKGGFKSKKEEKLVFEKANYMLKRILENPGPIAKKAIKIRAELPYFWLSEEHNIILCGKIDWLEYQQLDDSIKIIDFKTGRFDEDADSLQLPIYHLIVKNNQKRKVTGAAYWYLDKDIKPRDMILPRETQSFLQIFEIARTINLAKKLDRFVCRGRVGCIFCRSYEQIISGKAEYVGISKTKQDIYIL